MLFQCNQQLFLLAVIQRKRNSSTFLPYTALRCSASIHLIFVSRNRCEAFLVVLRSSSTMQHEDERWEYYHDGEKIKNSQFHNSSAHSNKKRERKASHWTSNVKLSTLCNMYSKWTTRVGRGGSTFLLSAITTKKSTRRDWRNESKQKKKWNSHSFATTS